MERPELENWRRGFINTDAQVGPVVAFAYTTHSALRGGFELTANERPSREVLMVSRILERLGTLTKDRELVSGDLRFKAHLIPEKGRGPSHKGFLAMVGSIGESYYQGNNDSVDAMYTMDSLGTIMLEEGLREGRAPIWAWANYNFQNMDRGNFEGTPGFSALMRRLRGE